MIGPNQQSPDPTTDRAADRAWFRAKGYEDKTLTLVQMMMDGYPDRFRDDYLDEMTEDELRDLCLTLQVLYKATRDTWELRVTTLRNTTKPEH